MTMIRIASSATFAATVLLTSLAAQGPFTSPPGYLTKEGLGFSSNRNGSAFRFAAMSEMRFQQVDGEIRGRGARTLRSVGFRADDSAYTSANGAGRSWSSVKLHLSAGDYATMGRTFSANQSSTPTMVFSGSVAFPTRTGRPATKPAPWAATYKFPFRTSYAYSGTTDLCLDWQFSGGKLTNNAPWARNRFAYYYLDGISTSTAVGFGSRWHRYVGTTNNVLCADPAITTSGAYARTGLQVTLRSKAYDYAPALANTAELFFRTYNTAPSAPVVHCLSLSGSTPGVAIGATCYNLMIDTSAALFFRSRADTRGNSPSTRIPMGSLDTWKSVGRSMSFWAQSAWTDSVSGKLGLTSAEQCTPDFAYALDHTTPKVKSMYSSVATSTSGSLPTVAYFWNPLARFE